MNEKKEKELTEKKNQDLDLLCGAIYILYTSFIKVLQAKL